MSQIFKNNSSGTLSSAVTDLETNIVLTSNQGNLFPTITGDDFFLVTLIGMNAQGAESIWEIVKCTAKAADTLTVIRGQEGTTAVAWPAGTKVELRLTAGTLDSFTDTAKAAAAMTAHTSDADPHAQYLPKAGGTMSGPISFAPTQTWPTFNQPTTGNAGTATKLATARTLTIGNTGKVFDGSGNLTWTLADIGVQAPLVSGNNIKTINGQSVLGAGNLVAGLSNFTESVSTSGENSTTKAAVGLTANGSAVNIDFCIVPKGAGAVLAQVPNGSTAGGKKRGSYAVDFQMLRNNSSQVASGDNSFIGGGKNNTTDGISSAVVGGHGNAVMDTGDTAFIGGGLNNTALGSDTVIGGGTYNVANGDSSTIPGGNRATTNGLLGLLAYGFYGNGQGQNQMAFWGGRLDTTSAAVTRITANSLAASATNQLTLRNNSAFHVRGTVVARNTSTNNAKEWTFEALIKRGANAAATSIVGTPSITSTFADADAASWAIAISADTTNGALAITGTGAASTSIRWTAVVHSIEVA